MRGAPSRAGAWGLGHAGQSTQSVRGLASLGDRRIGPSYIYIYILGFELSKVF
jgi:hypothetical protein